MHFTEGSQEDDWKGTMRRIGEALGRSRAADELVAKAQQGLAEVRERTLALEGATVSIFNAVAAGVYTINNPRDYAGRFCGELGMQWPDAVEGLDGEEYGRAVISEERYDLLDADILLGTSGESRSVLDKLERDPLFKRVDAVEQGRYIGLDIGPATRPAALLTRSSWRAPRWLRRAACTSPSGSSTGSTSAAPAASRTAPRKACCARTAPRPTGWTAAADRNAIETYRRWTVLDEPQSCSSSSRIAWAAARRCCCRSS